MSEKEKHRVIDLEELKAGKEIEKINAVLASLKTNEDELLSQEKEYTLAFAQLSIEEQEEQKDVYMNFLSKIGRIKKERGLSGAVKATSEELMLKLRAAFEANDIETLEELEKELIR